MTLTLARILAALNGDARRARHALTSPEQPEPPALTTPRLAPVTSHCGHTNHRVFGPCGCHGTSRRAR
jgi:hypothetical protein